MLVQYEKEIHQADYSVHHAGNMCLAMICDRICRVGCRFISY